MATPLTSVEIVRNNTTADTVKVPDALIERYILTYIKKGYDSEVAELLASADICEMLDRDVTWKTQTLGKHTFSMSTYSEKVSKFRARASISNAFTI